MKKNRRKSAGRLTAFMLCGALLAGSVTPVRAAEDNTPKEENVYVNLNQDGSVDGIYVVNAYRLDADTQIVDYGNYESVKNLTSDAEIQLQKGTVTVDAQAGEFFYQGNLRSGEIPWEISISYTLDGKSVSAQDLAGKNGKLGISIHVGQNDKADSDFFENYQLQVILTMDMERCSNLEAPGAAVTNVGTEKQLAYSVLAGREKDITVTADVLDFEMEAIRFQGLPMNLDVDRELFSMDDLHDSAGEISDAADEFSNGAQDLEGGVNSLQEGVKGIQSGAESLKEGIDSYADGAKLLGDGIDTLLDGSNDLADGAQELVDGILSLQDGANQLRDGYSGENGAASGARKLADGVKELKAGSYQLSAGVSALIDMISEIGGSASGSLNTEAENALSGAEALNGLLNLLGMGNIDTGEEGDSYAVRMEKLSDSLDQIIRNLISYLASGTGASAGNGAQDSMEPDADNVRNDPDAVEEETAVEEEGTEAPDDQTGAEEEAGGEETEEETGEDSGSTSAGDTGSQEESTSAGSAEETAGSEENSSGNETPSSAGSGSGNNSGSAAESETSADGGSAAAVKTSVKTDTGRSGKDAVRENTATVYKLSSVRRTDSGQTVRTAVSRNGGEIRLLSLSSETGSAGQNYSGTDISSLIGNLLDLKAGADQLVGAYGAVNEIAGTLGSEETQAQLALLKEGAAALDAGIGELESATDALADGIGQLADGTSQLADGVSELADGGSEFADGTKELADGVSELADGVTVLNDASDALRDGSAQLADGTGELLDGTGELADGISDLKDGTDEFQDKAGDMDTRIDEEVDGVINSLSGSDFEQISFVSDKNTNVELVQFVMQTGEIRMPEETDIPIEEEPMSFWQRLLALFGF